MKKFIIEVCVADWAHLETLKEDIVSAIVGEIDSVKYVEIEEKR